MNQLSEQEILAMPEADYMNELQLEFFRLKLIQLHESTRIRIQEVKQQMSDRVDLSDANDRASFEEQSAIALRIVDREQKLLPKIKMSLERIRLDTYGYCLESGEPIGVSRLLTRPTAEYSADVKALREKKEIHYNY